jgi:tetrahydromethanopterin S-methyltransferase subunit G
MAEPDRIILMFNEIRSEFRRMNIRLDVIDRRLDHEFNEIQDRLRRLDERVDGFIVRVKRLEAK